jgi:ABC-type ATPase with predicted acetyltransferase domain
MGIAGETKFVLYSYQPSLPYYFEQTDVLEVKINEKSKKIDINEVIEVACDKNYCTPEEIKIIDVFDSREDLDNYLVEHDLRYLS